MSAESPPVTDTLRPTQNLNVEAMTRLIGPAELEASLPMTAKAHRTVVAARDDIRAILRGDDPRLLVVLGPCSIHDPQAAMDYAHKLVALRQELGERLYIVMRVYFEKPRTTVGWKGLINDPHLDGSFDISAGLGLARRLLLDINALGLPAGTEMLDPITPQYIDDLIAWAAIGARTTESQTHRQMASGLSMPVGYKNGTEGNLQVALDAMQAARRPHAFLGIDEAGRTCLVRTRGNADGHVILRGGADKPNYDPANVADAAQQLEKANLPPRLMVDCSHANSRKKPERQEVVWRSLIDQVAAAGRGTSPIVGAMIESNLKPGKQPIPEDLNDLQYGVSVTDACLGWDHTAAMLREGAQRLGD